ncbi:SUMF1/EgtB/PvdO family nonheme iron enzyme [Methylovulum psychrotolerans]|uniref:Serine/threonine-protein kinase pkn1 n=1 Tax=Methylovulum psychrotolerans TaxID=1704499 RepID=A0A2S5CHM5_9GAMM|nr:SUMF1/EgtB/PvdO family nonheme iron enzyme [Methylovulum psychrotolerans]POZ50232.1 Serine/threonine-protein kinase pkn1 [Methylovulum psychrotolerans]
MSAQASPQLLQTYHIFLASPGDMNDERQMVREFFQDYNRTTANHQGLEFKVIDWQNYSHAGVGRAQKLITEQTLTQYQGSLVLLVGLLGQRFGTPTDIYESGTEEEFQTAMKFRAEQGGWPEIKWFFRQEWGKQGPPNNPQQLMIASNQWQKVLDFKSQLQTKKPLFLTADFASTDDFKDIFSHDLLLWLHDPARPWHKQKNLPSPDPALTAQDSPYLTVWLKLVRDECAQLPLPILDGRMGMASASPIELPDIFVPLKTIPPSKTWQETTAETIALARTMMQDGQQDPQPILDLLQDQRLAVVIGDPGSGKSALINQLTCLLLTDNLTHLLPDSLQGRIPLRIILRRVQIPAHLDATAQGQAAWLWESVKADIRATLSNSQQAEHQAEAVFSTLQHQLMQPPGGLILLDGLDEVPAADQRRVHLLQAIRALVSSLPTHTRFIITARPYAYTDPCWRLKGFSEFFLTPFDKEQRTQFIKGWYNTARSRFALYATDLKQRVEDLLDRVEHQPHLQELAERPLLLTLIAILHASGGRLPEDRVKLYEESVDLLLYRWRQEAFRDSDGQQLRLDKKDLLACLQSLAYNAHKAQQQQQADNRHTADISTAAIYTAFDPTRQRLYVLAGLALMELNISKTDALTKPVRQALVKLLADAQALNVSERAEAGRVLSGLGDPRPGVGLNPQGWPDIDWVKVPGGVVVLEDKAGTVHVTPFCLARYPVTNVQFQAFLDDADGYTNPHWWKGLDATPGTPELPRWTEANHPRESVSWFEAIAFCAWLSARLGYTITLPTEGQWQQAACSAQAGFVYPWGKKYLTGFANINETIGNAGPHCLERTTAVGIYPQGDSQQGISDLSGNVWEWCLNSYEDPSNTALSGTFSRMLRGGAWDINQISTYASCRSFHFTPNFSHSPIGFRVCCASPI